MKSPIRLSLLLLALLLSSCSYPSLKKPLSDPEKAKPDPQLFGVWRPISKDLKPQGATVFNFVGKSGHRDAPVGIMKSVAVGIDAHNDVDTGKPEYFFTTSIGNNTYLSFFDAVVFDRAKFPSWDKQNIKEYTVFKYKVEGDRVTVWVMDIDAVEAAIRKGQIEGTVAGEKNQKVITLTGGENLSKFLAAGGDKVLFPETEGAVGMRVKE